MDIQLSNYFLPAEWHRHAATQLHWPSNKETWPGERLERVEKVYLDIIEALHKHEPIHLLAESERVGERVQALFDERGIDTQQLNIHIQPVNDVWARDCGPIFVKNEQGDWVITDWEYNAWGGKYPPWDADNKLPGYFADRFNIPRIETGMVLEGGSIETNGNGTLLTTESVLLNQNRNPGMTKTQIEKKLKTYLGAEHLIWLQDGLAGDDTDGHIDDLARFLNTDTILAVVAEGENDVNYAVLQTNLEILHNAAGPDGNTFNIETLPLPETKIEGTTVDGSEYVPASYANFYIANGAVLVPLYDERYDARAMDLFEQYFPGREIIGIPCADLVWGQGSIHCITQQLYGI